MEANVKLERLGRLMADLEGRWIFVEGLRDKSALKGLGFEKILTISGNLTQSCDRLQGKADEVVVLTDLDRRGDELAKRAKDELEARSIKADIGTRIRFARLLGIRYFEDAERGYERLKQEGENNG